MMAIRVVAVILLAVVAFTSAQVTITTQPQPQVVVLSAGATTVATLSCTITGPASANYARRWFVSYDKGVTFVSFAETGNAAAGGSVTTTFAVPLPTNPIGTYPDGYLVYAGFRNTNPALPYDAFSSNTVAITIIKSPVIVVQPLDVLVDSGATATFNVTATGNIPTDVNGVPQNSLSYQWQVAVDTSLTWTSIAGATSPIYTTAATTPANNFARYRCVVGYTTAVGGVAATTTNVAVLRVAYITVTTQPSSTSVNEFSQASFTVAYTSYPAATVIWKQSATLDVPGGTGAQSTTYTTAPTTYAMNGLSFTAFISNGRTTVLAGPATLTVNRRLVITQQPANITVSAPAAASFVVGAIGTSPISYRWQVSSDGVSWTNVADPSAIAPTLALQSTTRFMNQLRYRALVSLTDALGTITLTSNVAFLTVLYAPVILTQPIRPLVITGDLVTLVLVVDANPPATYRWQSAQVNLPASFSNIAVDATGPSYRVTSIPVLDSIYYRVIASNSQGSATSDVVELRVNFPRSP